MRKALLTVLAVAAGAWCAAAQLPVRSLGGSIKTFNQTERHEAARKAVTRKAAASFRADEIPENALEVPFKHTLGKNDAETALYTPIDADGDGRTWKPSLSTAYVCMAPNTDAITANDDWLMSPPVHLLAGKKYTLGISVSSALSSGKEEKIAIFAGNEPTVEAMTLGILPESKADKANTYVDFKTDFTVEADGYYYFGIHCISDKALSKNTRAKDFFIEEFKEEVDPPVAGELSYVLAPNGELKADVTYTAPTKTQSGADLAAISKVEIKTNWVVTHTFTDMQPGESRTFETELYQGQYNRLEAIAYVEDTPGESILIKDFYAGPDNPLPVENLKIELSDDYKHVTVSWDPVGEVGESGGFVDVSKVQYYIFDAFGSYYDPALATTTETSYTFDYSDLEGQDFVAYQVTAGVDETYYSLETSSDIVIVGEPDRLPWHESFSDAYYAQVWAVDPASSSSGYMQGLLYDNELQTNMEDEGAEPEFLNSHDGDNGFYYFMPVEKDVMYGFFSTKIDISAAKNPVFEFFYQGKGSEIDMMLAKDGEPFQVARTINLKENPTDDWTLASLDLTPWSDARYIQVELRIRAVHNTDEYVWSVPIDNIRIRDLADSDLRLTAFKAPEKVASGKDIVLELNVENLGQQPCEGATVVLSRSGKEDRVVELPVIEPCAVAHLNITEPTDILEADVVEFTVAVNNENGTGHYDNTASANVAVEFPIFPAVAQVSAEADNEGNVSLGWTAPEFEDLIKPYTFTEDFESENYTPFAIKGVGDWTFVDGDGLKTYTFLKDSNNPYATSPMAYQLYEPAIAGMPDDYLIDVPCHSGNRFLAAWSCTSVNDNWLISPELSGNEQTVSFFARSFTIGIPETFEVLYSTTGKAVEDFVPVAEVGNYPSDNAVPESWTEFTAQLPAGARYFAIRHTAEDSYALFIDDITFERASALPADLEITGYNVYRNGAVLPAAPVSATAHNDHVDAEGTYRYHVSAVYNHGESRASAPADVEVRLLMGVDDVTGGNVSVAVDGCTLTVTCDTPATVTVAGAEGRIYMSSTVEGSRSVTLAPGVYIVGAGSFNAKVALR